MYHHAQFFCRLSFNLESMCLIAHAGKLAGADFWCDCGHKGAIPNWSVTRHASRSCPACSPSSAVEIGVVGVSSDPFASGLKAK